MMVQTLPHPTAAHKSWCFKRLTGIEEAERLNWLKILQEAGCAPQGAWERVTRSFSAAAGGLEEERERERTSKVAIHCCRSPPPPAAVMESIGKLKRKGDRFTIDFHTSSLL
jgi:hypothetical protein